MCVHGLGLDLIKNDFKVVRISYLGSENGFKVPPQVEIFALGAIVLGGILMVLCRVLAWLITFGHKLI